MDKQRFRCVNADCINHKKTDDGLGGCSLELIMLDSNKKCMYWKNKHPVSKLGI